MVGLVSFKEETLESSVPLPCGDTVGRWPCGNQEAGSYWEPSLPGTPSLQNSESKCPLTPVTWPLQATFPLTPPSKPAPRGEVVLMVSFSPDDPPLPPSFFKGQWDCTEPI